MKKIGLILVVVLGVFLTACKKEEDSKFKIGATVPAVDILNNLKEDFAKEGLDIEVVEFTDYVTPNIALDEGSIDANFFQHKPYLDFFKESRYLKLTALESVIISPIGIYSKKIKSIDDIEEGTEIGIPNDATNLARALLVLEDAGAITLDSTKGLDLTTDDIVDNPKNIKFRESEAAMLPRLLDDLDVTFINGNYAIASGLNPTTDSIYRESLDSPYSNIIAIREGEEENENIKTLMKVLRSQKSKDFINNTYDGGILPTF